MIQRDTKAGARQRTPPRERRAAFGAWQLDLSFYLSLSATLLTQFEGWPPKVIAVAILGASLALLIVGAGRNQVGPDRTARPWPCAVLWLGAALWVSGQMIARLGG